MNRSQTFPMEMKRTVLVAVVAVAMIALLAVLFVGNPLWSSSKGPKSGGTSTIGMAGGETAEETLAITLTDPTELPTAEGERDEGDSSVESGSALDDVWKRRLHGLLNNDTWSDRELGMQLLKIVEDEKAPDWVRGHAMANALNFTDDGNYGEDVKPLALRTDLPEVVNDVILEDLIIRDPLEILPVAREFAAMGQHPLAGAIEAFVQSLEETEVEEMEVEETGAGPFSAGAGSSRVSQ